VLQVLKAKRPVQMIMIHSSMNMASGEAFALLLKQLWNPAVEPCCGTLPWNPAMGLYNVEKLVKFDPQTEVVKVA